MQGCVGGSLATALSFPTQEFLGRTLVGLCTGQADHPLSPQGKVFPKLRKRSSMRSMDVEELGIGRATDYVFRIIYPGHRHEHSECPKLP